MELTTVENFFHSSIPEIIAVFPRLKEDFDYILMLCRTDYSPRLIINENRSIVPVIGFWKSTCDIQMSMLKEEMDSIKNDKLKEAKKELGSRPTKEQISGFMASDANYRTYSKAIMTWQQLRKIIDYIHLGFEKDIMVQASVNERKEAEGDGSQY